MPRSHGSHSEIRAANDHRLTPIYSPVLKTNSDNSRTPTDTDSPLTCSQSLLNGNYVEDTYEDSHESQTHHQRHKSVLPPINIDSRPYTSQNKHGKNRPHQTRKKEDRRTTDTLKLPSLESLRKFTKHNEIRTPENAQSEIVLLPKIHRNERVAAEYVVDDVQQNDLLKTSSVIPKLPDLVSGHLVSGPHFGTVSRRKHVSKRLNSTRSPECVGKKKKKSNNKRVNGNNSDSD
ncbi:uncharacterized protein LOC117108450 [Anneissia japonica]|uniref:uncharacterized protein LOC117108450 n=1 Tax=Anneissia japonica TaxID=1529436 RepID=UPI001425692F|nr:uncharacterized protein LOC117108450 [Anneissia japonica]XP_033106350.1 uncharacterized protein LOC117108450 [Anneissia japonica]XP_033106351.1 uncharacterized protein LOC117108450 [Anneissia japonica]